MSKKLTILIAVVAFASGVAIGRLNAAALYKRAMTQMTINSLTSDIGVTVVALKRLREGNSTNVAECLESELKGYLICLNTFDSAEKVRNEAYPKVIQMVQEYQRQFPEEVRPSPPK